MSNNFEKLAIPETKKEVMSLPEISVREEKSSLLLSLLFRGYDPNFGSHDHELSKLVDEYFKQTPLAEESVKFLEGIKALESGGTDGEALFNMALTRGHEERLKPLYEFIVENKGYIQDPQTIRTRLVEQIDNLEKALPEDLKKAFREATEADISLREGNLEWYKQRIKGLIDFFRPDPETTKTKKITILPTNFLMPEKSGVAYDFGDEQFVEHNINNPHNFAHEFLHGVVNPIVDKLSLMLTEEQERKISQIGSYQLKVEQGYGGGHFSLLCEEFIRTYNDVLENEEKPETYDGFREAIASIDESEFSKTLNEADDGQRPQDNKEWLRKHCRELGISNLEGMKEKSQEYYDRFLKNELREIIYGFYQDYIKEKEKNSEIRFEEFVLNEFPKRI